MQVVPRLVISTMICLGLWLVSELAFGSVHMGLIEMYGLHMTHQSIFLCVHGLISVS